MFSSYKYLRCQKVYHVESGSVEFAVGISILRTTIMYVLRDSKSQIILQGDWRCNTCGINNFSYRKQVSLQQVSHSTSVSLQQVSNLTSVSLQQVSHFNKCLTSTSVSLNKRLTSTSISLNKCLTHKVSHSNSVLLNKCLTEHMSH